MTDPVIPHGQTKAMLDRAFELNREARDIDATMRPCLFLMAAMTAACEAWKKSGRDPGKHPFEDIVPNEKFKDLAQQSMLAMRAMQDLQRAFDHCTTYVATDPKTWKEIDNAPNAAK